MSRVYKNKFMNTQHAMTFLQTEGTNCLQINMLAEPGLQICSVVADNGQGVVLQLGILGKLGRCGLDSSGSGQRPVVGCWERGNVLRVS
jgi:hypothetical protein